MFGSPKPTWGVEFGFINPAAFSRWMDRRTPRAVHAEVSISRQIRVVVVIRNALRCNTLSRSAPRQRGRFLHHVLGVGHRPKHAICETEQSPAVRLKARGRIRHCARELTSCARPLRDATAGQSQPAEDRGDQPQHQARGATDYSVAAAGTTVGDGQNQPAVDDGD